jgi:NitT/TauT family transport system substrate-binding protein
MKISKIIVAISLFLPVFLCACSSGTDKSHVLRLGYLQNDLHHLPLFVAIEKGFFQQEGVAFEIAGIFKAGPEEMSAFAAKELDIGYVGQAPATAAVLNGAADVKFVAQVNLEGSAIVVRKDNGYKKLFQLTGKTVAIPGHSTMQEFLLRRALKKSNIKVKNINIMVLKPPEMLQALDLGNIDAFIAWEPYPAQAVRKGSGEILLSSEDIWMDHPCCVLVADAEFCNKFPEIVKKIQIIHQRACLFINKNPQMAVDIGMKYTGLDRDTVFMAISNIKYDPVMVREKCFEFVSFLKNLQYLRSDMEEKSLSSLFYE